MRNHHLKFISAFNGVQITNPIAGVTYTLKFFTDYKATTAGTDQGAGLSFDDCFLKCVALANCKAFDYKSTTKKCEATAVAYPCTGIAVSADTGTTHYVLTVSCGK